MSDVDAATVSHLFNELHSRLITDAEGANTVNLGRALGDIASKVDELHHDYTMLCL